MYSRFFVFILMLISVNSFAFDHVDSHEWVTGPVSLIHTEPAGRQRIMQEYFRWQGTRYLWGGDSHRGIDCSAFTRRIMLAALHRHLPRTAAEQKRTGTAVLQRDLEPGDLVFFITKPHCHHVGIYVGKGLFIHASSSHGVMMSSLDSPYWHAHYLTARREVA
ncbi:C40 family peptidase [Citrobacter werkmanii]|uniref:C40 family peptidase n=1 Tax=Citrobacter werkmanii TaxID=67827 RepID=UPI0037CB20AB